jgi:hypothetical protein
MCGITLRHLEEEEEEMVTIDLASDAAGGGGGGGGGGRFCSTVLVLDAALQGKDNAPSMEEQEEKKTFVTT